MLFATWLLRLSFLLDDFKCFDGRTGARVIGTQEQFWSRLTAMCFIIDFPGRH